MNCPNCSKQARKELALLAFGLAGGAASFAAAALDLIKVLL